MMLKGQVAIVTGASRGIGRAIALALAHAGADVAIGSRDTAALQAVARELERAGAKTLVMTIDAHERDQIEALVAKTFETFGRLDILVNNAGTIILKSFDNTSVEQYAEQMNLHYMATVIACKAAVPLMRKQGSGKIINISSISGTVGYEDHSAYSPAKGAIIRFSEAIAKELKKDHINVNCIAPNAVDTALFDEWIAEEHPVLDRSEWIQPSEIGELAVFLCSPAARSITGETIVLQGIYQA
ncbi:MAG TPA: SDR family oxidoreductase [Anaerolineae bacterium]|nr:SDR family oxidoreductase [Anaerolineae bacterium]